MNIAIKNVQMVRNGALQKGDIYIQGNEIVPKEVANSREIDGRGKLATAGFVNAHTHASMTLLRSYSDDKALMDWLQKDIWPIESKMRRQDIRVGAQMAAIEMIKSGTTAFADMYGPCMEEVAKVVDESGMRGSLSRGIIGIADGEKKLEENVELYKDYQGSADGRITIMFGPHAIYTCPPDFLRKVGSEASKLGAEIHIHMNETRVEVEDCIKAYGKRPFEVVESTGLFEEEVKEETMFERFTLK